MARDLIVVRTLFASSIKLINLVLAVKYGKCFGKIKCVTVLAIGSRNETSFSSTGSGNANLVCQSGELGVLCCHTLTFLSAVHARFGTLLAVIHLMFRTFLTACTAYLGAKGTELLGVLTFAAHQGSGKRTNVCAVTVQLDAAGHHFHVVLAQARRGTRFAH